MVMSEEEVAGYCAEHLDVSGVLVPAAESESQEGARKARSFGEGDEWLLGGGG